MRYCTDLQRTFSYWTAGEGDRASNADAVGSNFDALYFENDEVLQHSSHCELLDSKQSDAYGTECALCRRFWSGKLVRNLPFLSNCRGQVCLKDSCASML